MNKITIFLLLLISSVIVQGQQINNIIKDSKGKKMLLGKTNKKAFEGPDFSWFHNNYNQYVINDKVIELLKQPITDYKIKAFYGSWCGDSKRQIPRFYKVLDQVGFNTNNLIMVAVNKTPTAYKTSPNGEEKGLNIHRVPTFIFYKDNKEVGRIVESPKQDFERDLLAIVTNKKYTPNYEVVERLNSFLQVKTIKELNKVEDSLVASFADLTKGSRELNTYAYKLLRSHQIEKALFVFSLNTKIFPYKHNVFDSLAEAYYSIEDFEKSLDNYNIVLRLKPNDKNALNMIRKIKTEKI